MSWQEKLMDSKGFPKVVEITPKMAEKWGTKPHDTVVIPAPLEVDGIMRRVPKGKLITINQIRDALAKRHRATIGCPITTGIFAAIAARAAADAMTAGKKDITPYWRTLKQGGVINEKYPGGIELQKRLLEQEGHKVVQKRKRFVVKDFETKVINL